MIKKAIKLNMQCFLYMYMYKFMWNAIIFFFIDSYGRHMQNIVNKRCVAGGGQCL